MYQYHEYNHHFHFHGHFSAWTSFSFILHLFHVRTFGTFLGTGCFSCYQTNSIMLHSVGLVFTLNTTCRSIPKCSRDLVISDIAIFVLKRDVKLQLTNSRDLMLTSRELERKIASPRLKMAECRKCNKLLKDWCGNMNIATIWYFKSSGNHYQLKFAVFYM